MGSKAENLPRFSMNPEPHTCSPEETRHSRIVLVDDHVGMRQALAVVLRLEKDLDVVGEADGGCGALKICRALKPDLVILDLAMTDLGGLFVLRAVRESVPALRVVVYTGTENEESMRMALREEPEGFVRKTDPLQVLRTAIRTVLGGGRFLSPFAAQLMSRPEPRLDRLTGKELAVLQLIALGKLTKEIAEVLDAKPKTVDHHRQHLMNKLGIHDVASLTRFAIIEGLGSV